MKKIKMSRLKNALRVLSLFCLLSTLIFMFQNCGGGFDAAKTGVSTLSSSTELPPSSPPPSNSLDGRALYTQNCASCHGPVDSSAKRNRTQLQIELAIESVPLMRNILLTRAEVELIASALITQASPPPVQNESARQEYACTPGQMQRTPMAKLTNREYRAALNSLLDGFASSLKADAMLVNLMSSVPTDIAIQDRDTLKEQSLLNTAPITNGLFDVAFRAGELVAGSTVGLQNYPNTNQCLGASAISQACHQNFVRELASRAFRRQLSLTEGQTLATRLWDSNLSKGQLIQLTVTAIATMPDFLYKIYDRGTPIANGSTIINMTGDELASKLAFFLTGGPPDDTLRGLGASGQILTTSVLTQQVDRLLATPAARDTVRRFFRESYGYDVFDRLDYNSAFIGNINTAGLSDVMSAELDNYFSEVVLNRNGTFRDLMTSRYTSYSDSRLGAIYGVNGTTNLPDERAGFLNRAAMLTKRSGYAASPIKRGLHVLEHVLCQEIGLPPPSAPTALPTLDGQPRTTRDRTASTTEVAGTSCVQCHSRMNNLGYAFELFDSFGRLRLVENIYSNNQLIAQLAINSATTTSELASNAVSVSGSRQLVEQLGNNDRAMMCFVKHLKRFESRIQTDSSANCQMNESLRTLYGTNNAQGSITAAIRSFILSPEFRRWNY
jgi:hypothetical protein